MSETRLNRSFTRGAILGATASVAIAVSFSACRTSSPSSMQATCYGFEDTGAGTKTVAFPGSCDEQTRAAAFPAGWRFKPGEQATFARSSMVASNSELASAAGVEIMRAGGNAVDAAVATGFALAVTYPVAGNLGGGGYMVIRMADGRTAAVDYREIAPLAATRDMYIGPDGKPTDESVDGYTAAGGPGEDAGMAAALARFGAKPIRDVLQPAIRLAESGFTVDSALARSLENARELIGSFAGGTLFVPTGTPLPRGHH